MKRPDMVRRHKIRAAILSLLGNVENALSPREVFEHSTVGMALKISQKAIDSYLRRMAEEGVLKRLPLGKTDGRLLYTLGAKSSTAVPKQKADGGLPVMQVTSKITIRKGNKSIELTEEEATELRSTLNKAFGVG